jgi:hypothetical protein
MIDIWADPFTWVLAIGTGGLIIATIAAIIFCD